MTHKRAAATPRTDEAAAMVTVPFESQEKLLVAEAVPADFARQLERELTAAQSRLAEVERACGQASFCLRELLPNDADAQMTVKMIDSAIQKGKP